MPSGEGDCFSDNPYMRPEYVSDAGGDDKDCSPKTSGEYKHRLLRRSRHREQTNQQRCPSRSSSPFLKAPKIIKNDCDDSLYVKVEDLPDDVREQVRQLASGCPDGNSTAGGDGCGENIGDDATARLSRNASAFPFNEPRRLSAQPTVEEIQMCFAQVDLAILMEPKIGCGPPRPRPCPSPCRRPSTAAIASRSRGMSPCPDTTNRRREKCRASPVPVPIPDPAFDSDATGCDPPCQPCQPPRPASAAAGYSNSGARVRQLLAEFASSRRHAGGATQESAAEANYDMTAKRGLSKNLAADCDSTSGARTNRDHSNELSYLRDDFARKLEQIHALAGLSRDDVAGQRNCGQEQQPLGSPCGSNSGGGDRSRNHKRSLQVPVWTSTNNSGGSSGGNGGNGSRSRGRFRSNWSRSPCEDGELSNDSDCATADDC